MSVINKIGTALHDPQKIFRYTGIRAQSRFLFSHYTEDTIENVQWEQEPSSIQFCTDKYPESLTLSLTKGLNQNCCRIQHNTGDQNYIQYQPPSRFINHNNDVILFPVDNDFEGKSTVYIDTNGKIIGPLVSSTKDRNISHLSSQAYPFQKKLFLSKFLPKDGKKARYGTEIDQAMSLATKTSNNYGHWLLEHLPRLHRAEIMKNSYGTYPNIILPSLEQWQKDCLDLIGVPESKRVIINDDPILIRDFIQTDIKSVYSRDFDICVEDYMWLSNKLKENVDLSKADFSNRILLSRQNVGRRMISNYSETLDLLEDYGFESYRPEDLNIRDQVRLFNNADVIIGTTGSGFANIIFGEAIDVIPIIDRSWISGLFLAISQSLNHSYNPIYSNEMELDNSCFTEYPDKNITVDIDKLETKLQRTFDGDSDS